MPGVCTTFCTCITLPSCLQAPDRAGAQMAEPGLGFGVQPLLRLRMLRLRLGSSSLTWQQQRKESG